VIVTEWGEVSQWFNGRVFNEWHRRLECIVQQQERHVETLNKTVGLKMLRTVTI